MKRLLFCPRAVTDLPAKNVRDVVGLYLLAALLITDRCSWANAREPRRLHHPEGVQCVAYAPNGLRLAAGGKEGFLTLWDLPTGRACCLSGHTDTVLSAAFGPDCRLLASAGADGTVRIWDVATARECLVLRGHTQPIWSVAFSPDGKSLAVAAGAIVRSVRGGAVFLLDKQSGAQRTIRGAHAEPVFAVAFSPDIKSLASAGADRIVKEWDLSQVISQEPDSRARPVH